MSDGLQIAPEDFLSQVLTAGGYAFFDAWSTHPYCWPASPLDTSASDAGWNSFQRTPLILSLLAHAATSGPVKPLWLTEAGSPVTTSITAVGQAQAITDAFAKAKQIGAAALFIYVGENYTLESQAQAAYKAASV
jgi:hypothetical protein